ncbi:hypothetical protein [Sulfitobacter sp. MOLA879]|uniref:hypothetical protein n=1 Tax=Sulfitobacter sp. MOLA879 TaxID=3368579 RepID=UPI0037466815
MNGRFTGSYVLSVEHDTEAGVPWFGNLTVPEDKSESVKFELFSENPCHSKAPFKELESQSGTIVRGWLNSNRPITLIEPYITYSGGGGWSAGYRNSAAIRGAADNYIEDEHFLGGEEREISEIGFSSDALDLICRAQAVRTDAVKSVNFPFESLVMHRSVSLKGLGELTLKIAFKTDSNGEEIFARSFTRLVEPERLTIWQVIEFSHLQLALLDFLAGKPTGDYNYGILGARGWDSSLRLMGSKRGEADKKPSQTRTILDDPISLVPQLISKVWHVDELKEQIFVATTLIGANLGFIEKFSRTSAYLEQRLRKRYRKSGLASRQSAYKQGIAVYRDFIKSGGKEITDFANRFAKPVYPRESTLRELFEMAITECAPLGLTVPNGYERELVQLRNEVFHGHEGSSREWMKKIQFATEVGIAVLELLTAKDIGLTPPNNYRPRHDTLGTQLGIYG